MALRRIKKDEELLWYYSDEFSEELKESKK